MVYFTPYSWSKLVFLRDVGDTEIGGFGICADADNPLLVTDVKIVKQVCTSVTVKFDDASVADLFDDLVDEGLKPAQFGRIWIHTHPGTSAEPSGVDEETFQRVFSSCDFAIMFILARGGETYARCRYGVGPRSQLEIDSNVDYFAEFRASDSASWKAEYDKNVTEEVFFHSTRDKTTGKLNGKQTVFGAQAPFLPHSQDKKDDGSDYWSKEERIELLAGEYNCSIDEVMEFAIEGIDY